MAEQNYPVHKQESLAVVNALKKWRLLLIGMEVKAMSNHHSLKHLLTQKVLSQQQSRLLEVLVDFNLDIDYILGSCDNLAENLSRLWLVALEVGH